MDKAGACIGAIALCLAPCAALGDDPSAPPPPKEASAPSETGGPAPEGPEVQARLIPATTTQDVAGRIENARAEPAGLLETGPVSQFDRWFDSMNERLDADIGLQFSLSYQLTFQAATSGPGDRSGAEGALDLSAAWRLIGAKDDIDTGTLNVNAQHINEIGETPPANLSGDIGAIWATSDGTGYDQNFVVDQLYFEQMLHDGKVMLVAGKISAGNYVGTNRFADDSVYFMNTAFSSNPALDYPGAGFGAVVAGRITDWVYLGGCIADANAQETQMGFDSIGYADFFYALELGLTPTIRGCGEGNYRFTAWYSDAATKLDYAEDYGLAISCDQDLGSGIFPFLKYAWSDGAETGVRNIVSGGVGLEGFFGRADDVIGIGLSWGEGTDVEFEDQVVGEVFYRLQVSAGIQFTLGGQVIANALDKDSGSDETVGIIEARVRIAF